MSTKANSLLELSQLVEEGALEQPEPFGVGDWHDHSSDAERLCRIHALTDQGSLECVLISSTFASLAEDNRSLHHSIWRKVRGPERLDALVSLEVAARNCLSAEVEQVHGLLSLEMLDIIGPRNARQFTSVIELLAKGIPIRTSPVTPDDPFALNLVVEPLLVFFRAQRPDATEAAASAFVVDALIERWPAMLPAISSAVSRVWRSLIS